MNLLFIDLFKCQLLLLAVKGKVLLQKKLMTLKLFKKVLLLTLTKTIIF